MLKSSLRIEIAPGTKLEDAFMEAIRLASILNVRVRFKFNGIDCSVRPDSDLDKSIATWRGLAEEEA